MVSSNTNGQEKLKYLHDRFKNLDSYLVRKNKSMKLAEMSQKKSFVLEVSCFASCSCPRHYTCG